ncbi:MAG: glycosyltransferase family 1 protein [Terracidiphilus sp.]
MIVFCFIILWPSLVPRSIKRAARILAVSEHTKADIIKYYDIPADKISVIYNAVDHSEYYPRPAKEVSAVRSKYKLPAKYILFTGTIEPRKNVEGILGAYAALDEQVKKDHGLVLAGGKGWNDEPIRQAIDKLKSAGEKIICTGYVPDEDLPALFSGASLFVYPSFYEGFGIPPLEAMACGVPVITADNSSLPEVVGDAVIMIKAENIAAITQSISKVLNDSQLANSLRQKGLEQAKKFSWEKSAQTLITLLNSLKS